MTLFRIFPYAAIKFVAYEEFRVLLIPSADKDTGVRRFLAGSFSGVTSVFFTYPLEVVRVRMAFGTRKYERTSIKEVFRKIYHEGVGRDGPAKGIHNFYRGFSPTLVGMFPYAGVSFWTHDFIGDLFRNRFAMHATLSSSEDYQERRPLTFWAELISGGIAGLSSQTASYPLEIIRRRMQVGGTVGAGKFLTMWETAKLVWTTSGVRGFFVGLSIGYIKVNSGYRALLTSDCTNDCHVLFRLRAHETIILNIGEHTLYIDHEKNSTTVNELHVLSRSCGEFLGKSNGKLAA